MIPISLLAVIVFITSTVMGASCRRITPTQVAEAMGTPPLVDRSVAKLNKLWRFFVAREGKK